MGLNLLIQTQHNEVVRGYNEGELNATIRRLGVDTNKGGVSNTLLHAQVSMSLKHGWCMKTNNKCLIDFDTILELYFNLTHPYKTDL